MKKLAIFVVLAALYAGCSAPAYAAPRNSAQSQARAARKAQKKQQKAVKKYLKAQRKAQKKMIKHDRKNTHYPKHTY
jgi:Na+-translocating ferredoxin:NAD+ oxidoreductase RNF subunit RnfB